MSEDNQLTETDGEDRGWLKGPLAWMAQNIVASNLLMALFIVGGILMLPRIKQEVFPEVTLDSVTATVAYPGASPAEVEKGTVLAIEEQVRGLDGVKEVVTTVNEGSASVRINLLLGTNRDQALNDVKSSIDRITSFPEEIERPLVNLASNRREVLSLVIYGDTDEKTLRALGERVREDLLSEPGITNVDLTGVRKPEISIEVPQESLRRYNLTLEQVSGAVRRASIELPGGGIKTPGGEVLLRTAERRDYADGFADIVVLAQPDGTQVTIGDLGSVVDGFEDVDQATYFNGQAAVRVTVFRVGDQTPIQVSNVVRGYLEQNKNVLPPGIQYAIWNDSSNSYRERIDLLLRNAIMGLALVLLVLGMFLQIKLAFWVTLGIPISFMGAMLFMPAIDVSLNMISLFAFILTLGIVVDDAIVVGEAVYTQRKEGNNPLKAAIMGVREVATPVTFSVLTTVVAFSPLLFVPGVSGKFFKNIPMIVIPILLISLVESLLVLPAHLSHSSPSKRGIFGAINRAQQWFADKVEMLIDRGYRPLVEAALGQRYLTVAVGLALLITTVGMVAGGRIKITFFPEIEGDVVTARLTMPFGTAVEDTDKVRQKMERAALELFEELGGQDAASRGLLTNLGSQTGGGGPGGGTSRGGGHIAQVAVFLVPSAQRDISTADFTRRWRERVGQVPGVESLTFSYNIGPQNGAPVNVELSHPDPRELEAAADLLAERLATYGGVYDIEDGSSLGKEQIDFTLKPAARTLGITETDLARQVRNAFYGSEAARQQRGRDELRVFVRRPESERTSLYDLERLMIRTPNGGEIPLGQAATIKRGRSYTSITRQDGRRVVRVTSEIDIKQTSSDQILEALRTQELPMLTSKYPQLRWEMGGQQRDRNESLGALGVGFIFALVVMYGLMAVVFRSYLQPVIVMAAIPFGIVGAVAGHLLMDFNLSLISMMGIVALSGVVVNDSLVLVDAVNKYRKEMPLEQAVVAAGVRRFRPILLTTLTTFFGLMPMILEKSVQARFLVPMAVSLGFGILFVTFIALILVPTMYMILFDLKGAASFLRGLYGGDDDDHDGGSHGRPGRPGVEEVSASTPEAADGHLREGLQPAE